MERGKTGKIGLSGASQSQQPWPGNRENPVVPVSRPGGGEFTWRWNWRRERHWNQTFSVSMTQRTERVLIVGRWAEDTGVKP